MNRRLLLLTLYQGLLMVNNVVFIAIRRRLATIARMLNPPGVQQHGFAVFETLIFSGIWSLVIASSPGL